MPEILNKIQTIGTSIVKSYYEEWVET